jgi:hypothetical protein
MSLATPRGGAIKRGKMIAWLLCCLCVAGATANLVIWYVSQPVHPAWSVVVDKFGWLWLLPVVYSVVAALIIARQPDNRVGWLLMVPALTSVISTEPYLITPRSELTHELWLLLWYDNISWTLLIFPIFLIPLHFPTGHPPSSRWNWVNWLALALFLFFLFCSPFFGATIGPMNSDWRLPNPIGWVPDAVVNGPFLFGWGIGLVTVAIASVTSLVVRYRHSGSRVRQQIKWLLMAGIFFIPIYAGVFFLTDPEANAFATSRVVSLVLLVPILGFAVAIAIAILRYQLYDIDVIFRKTLVYTALTALLALVYFGSVVVLQTIVGRTLGEQSSLSIVVSTLLIAALFVPLRNRVQDFIDRRFFRKKYDAQQALASFAQSARNEVELETLTADLMQTVAGTLQPQQVAIWLQPENIRESP